MTQLEMENRLAVAGDMEKGEVGWKVNTKK